MLMVLVSLDGTYNLTYNLFGNLIGVNDQSSYGLGLNLKNKGFILHIVLFTILLVTPMLLCKSSES